MAAGQLDDYAARCPVQILCHEGRMAVWHAGLRQLQAVLTAPGPLTIEDGLTLAVDQRCLLVYAEGEYTVRLAVANPLNLPARVQVTVSRHLEGEGCAWNAAAGVTRVSVVLPDGQHAGQSVVRQLRRVV